MAGGDITVPVVIMRVQSSGYALQRVDDTEHQVQDGYRHKLSKLVPEVILRGHVEWSRANEGENVYDGPKAKEAPKMFLFNESHHVDAPAAGSQLRYVRELLLRSGVVNTVLVFRQNRFLERHGPALQRPFTVMRAGRTPIFDSPPLSAHRSTNLDWSSHVPLRTPGGGVSFTFDPATAGAVSWVLSLIFTLPYSGGEVRRWLAYALRYLSVTWLARTA